MFSTSHIFVYTPEYEGITSKHVVKDILIHLGTL